MTNFEKYKSDVLNELSDFAVDKITRCSRCCGITINCRDCLFNSDDMDCNNKRLCWLYEEYEEVTVDWSKVPIDTKVMVSHDGENWSKRYFAKVSDKGNPLVWYDGLSSWTAPQGWYGQYKYVKLAEEE